MDFPAGEKVTFPEAHRDPVPQEHQDLAPAAPKGTRSAKWKLLLQSRKFWAAVVGLALVIFRGFYPNFPVSDELLTKAVLLIIAYIVGTALEDARGLPRETRADIEDKLKAVRDG